MGKEAEKNKRYFITYDREKYVYFVTSESIDIRKIWFTDEKIAEKIAKLLSDGATNIADINLKNLYRRQKGECESHIRKCVYKAEKRGDLHIEKRNKNKLPGIFANDELTTVIRDARDEYCEKLLPFNQKDFDIEKGIDTKNKKHSRAMGMPGGINQIDEHCRKLFEAINL